MKHWALGASAAVFIASSAAAITCIPVERQMTCPLDGERFSYMTTAAYTTSGERPDGRPYSSSQLLLNLPECPRSGFVVFKEEFTPAEVDRIRPLVESQEYRALRQETSFL